MKVLIYSNPNLMDCDMPLVRALQDKGIDVTYLIETNSQGMNSTLLTIKNGHKYNGIEKASSYQEFSFFSTYLNVDKIYFSNYYKKHRMPLLDSLLLTIKNFKFLYDNNFDVIQRTQVFFFTDVLLYFFRKKIVKIVHDPFPHSGNVMKGWIKIFYNLGMRIIPRFVVLNHTQYDRFCDVYKKNRQNVLLNRLGVYDCYNLFYKSEKKETKITNNILFFGRISKYKGIEYLCEAMEIVHRTIPEATVSIVGGGEYYFDIEKYRKLDYFKIVNRYVTAQELSLFLAECTIAVCPYTDSTQSGVVMTSFSHNKPVVASNVGGLSEQIENRKSGMLVRPKDATALANVIVEILQNKKLLNDMEDYIDKEYFKGDKSWNAIAQKYIDFYSFICKSSKECR